MHQGFYNIYNLVFKHSYIKTGLKAPQHLL
jgi:hypothetical protein